ncbi:Rpn family recombination-promoting nuclease/putative transposase [Candidatus Marithioploca araucensis]|uniref:Rpn family recombination-promoting nuclease/putative transposase n=1 Tax=Candidatus Marithioploca araucensis TaxID=70273 RepID=A0ABT7VQW0_9GAMM|nr:Rpn family recombination-promoting nuclease/putative transposase [Candidatus Marithioploca araucensis]
MRKRTKRRTTSRQKTGAKRTKSKRTQYDQSYKRLFSHPKMIEDLLRGFIHEDWVKELDFSTLEVFKDSFVSDNLLERHDDIIWRVRWRQKKWLYVYLRAGTNLTFLMRLVGKKKTLPTLQKSLNCAREQYTYTQRGNKLSGKSFAERNFCLKNFFQ